MGKVKKENSIIPSFNPVCIFQWIFKTTLNELLQKCNHGSISYYTNVAFSLPSNDIHSFIHQQLQNAYYVPGTGVWRWLRVLTRIFFILLSQYFQLVYGFLNGAIVLEGGALREDTDRLKARWGVYLVRARNSKEPAVGQRHSCSVSTCWVNESSRHSMQTLWFTLECQCDLPLAPFFHVLKNAICVDVILFKFLTRFFKIPFLPLSYFNLTFHLTGVCPRLGVFLFRITCMVLCTLLGLIFLALWSVPDLIKCSVKDLLKEWMNVSLVL